MVGTWLLVTNLVPEVLMLPMLVPLNLVPTLLLAILTPSLWVRVLSVRDLWVMLPVRPRRLLTNRLTASLEVGS